MGKATRNIGKNNWGGKKTKRSKYMTRNEAVKYLQLSLGDFRRLCILKGIHPKQPTKTQLKNKSKLVTSKPLRKGVLYYYAKDIKFMNHDPLIVKFREHKIFLRRLAKAEAKQDTTHAQALQQNVKPHFTYDHLVKERYPTFNAALNDLDDCLTLMFMFNHLPSGYGGIEPQRLTLVKKLCDEFCTWAVKTNSLRKCFLSFKGIYYQADVCGVPVTWIVPYGFTQQIPQEADFKVFKTFLTFYTTLMTFVNFKLYHDCGEVYPPECPEWKQSLKTFLIDSILTGKKNTNDASATSTTEEDRSKYEQQQNEIRELISSGGYNKKQDNEEDNQELDTAVEVVEEEEKKSKTVEELFMDKYKSMFKNLTFYISRECPIASLEFIIRAFQGKVVSELTSSTRITHYVVDRPSIPQNLPIDTDTIEFVQPQWVYDSINAKLLIPVDQYKPGQKLPPHLSPFEQDLYKDKSVSDGTVYEPKYAQELRKMLEQEMAALRRIQRKHGGMGTEDDRGILRTIEMGIESQPQEIAEDDEQVEDIRAVEADSDSDEEEQEELRYSRELEMEKTGMKYADFAKQLEQEDREKQIKAIKSGQQLKTKQQLKEEQEIELRKSMMSRRKAKLYEHEMKKVKKSKKRVNELMQKRLEYEEQAETASTKNQEQPSTFSAQTAEDSDSDSDNEVSSKSVSKFDMDNDEDEAYDLSKFEPIEDDEDDDEDLLGDIDVPEDASSSDDDEPAPQPPVSKKPQPKQQQPKKNNQKQQQQPKSGKKEEGSKKRKEAPAQNKKAKKQRVK